LTNEADIRENFIEGNPPERRPDLPIVNRQQEEIEDELEEVKQEQPQRQRDSQHIDMLNRNIIQHLPQEALID
jgi:hypothetical protein